MNLQTKEDSKEKEKKHNQNITKTKKKERDTIMAEITVDLTEATDFAPIPDGTYCVRVNEEPTSFVAESSGTPCLKWEFTLTEEEGQEEYAGRKLWRNTPLTGKGSGFTKDVLTALGVPFSEIGDGDQKGVSFRTEDCLGRMAVANVKTGTYEGKPKNDIKSLSPLPGAEGSGDPDEI